MFSHVVTKQRTRIKYLSVKAIYFFDDETHTNWLSESPILNHFETTHMVGHRPDSILLHPITAPPEFRC